MLTPDGMLVGVGAAMDKDHASALLAESLRAEMYPMLTDVSAVLRRQ